MEKIKFTVGKIYKIGSEASFVVIVLGLFELLLKRDAIKPESLNIFILLRNAFTLDPYSTLYLGLIVLISTPILVVLYLFVAYFAKRSYKEGFIALFILLIIGLSIYFGFKNR